MKLKFKFNPILETEGKNSREAQNLIILHGLFGSSKNWVSISKLLSKSFNVYSLDLRNHGDSPHSEEHSISAMSEDLHEFITTSNLKNVTLLGHSMGGLVSMYYDLTHPGILKSLLIQDIAPKSYPFIYENEVNSMLVDVSSARSRAEVDELMKPFVPNDFIRMFLQMNLERDQNGKYFWKLNVKGIAKARKLFEDLFSDLLPSNTPSLFILGANSEYIKNEDELIIKHFFKNVKIDFITDGGHYIHFTHTEEFMRIIHTFINSFDTL